MQIYLVITIPFNQKQRQYSASERELSKSSLKNLVNSMRLSSILFSVLLLTTTISLNIAPANAALTAITANTIQGTAPYIELNGVKATDLSSLLSIKIGSDIYISDSSEAMKRVNADGTLTPVGMITLSNANAPFNSVGTIVSPDTISYALNSTSIVLTWARKDADGDGTFAITDSIKGEWTDKLTNPIATDTSGKSILTNVPTICNAPYTLKLTTTGSPSISTLYGDPKQTSYVNSTAIFKINPASQARICFAKPSLMNGTGVQAGPVMMWDPSNGFLVQSTVAATYGNNFPTTGANGLYFDLDIAGVNATQLKWGNSATVGAVGGVVTNGNITAKITAITATSIRIMLIGPAASSFTITGATAPAATGLNKLFVIVGRDTSNSAIVSYRFILKKWFVSSGTYGAKANFMKNWFVNLGGGYVLPQVKDLTNSNITLFGVQSGATPYSSGNYFQRHINAGLFTEWGRMSSYIGANFQNGDCHAINATNLAHHVQSYSGLVGGAGNNAPYYGACTQP